MVRSLLCLVLLSLFSLALRPSRLQADIITAEYVPSSFNSSSTAAGFNDGVTFLPAQIFTATVGGDLSKISVGVWSTAAANLIVELRSVSANLPTSTVLASGSINPAIAFADQNLYSVDLSSSGVSLIANTQYAISLRTTAGSPNVGWSGDNSNSYAGGNLAVSSDNGATWNGSATQEVDAVFRVTITAVPEPSACLLTGLGACAVAIQSRRRTKR